MHSLIAFTFPEMGQGILAVVVLGASLLALSVVLAMIHSTLQLLRAWVAQRAITLKPRRKRIAVRLPARVRLPDH
jgi:hypothetical protein